MLRSGAHSSPASAPSPRVVVDGNHAAAHVAYALSDTHFVFPITPSTAGAQLLEQWSSSLRHNALPHTPTVPVLRQLESEAGVAGALHGALQCGALSSTFTSSQGLMLMIPALHKIAGEALPLVIHLAARSVSSQGVSIFSDHSDVNAARQTGVALLSSHSVQEAHDLGLVAHLAAVTGSTPFIHFYEGMQISHELASCRLLPYQKIGALVPASALRAFRARALNPERPRSVGVVLGRDTYWQHQEADYPRIMSVPQRVQDAMNKVAVATGRRAHSLFEYHGASDADRVVVCMGAGSQTVQLAVDRLAKRGEKVGVLKVHLYRPWSAEAFLSALPRSAKKVAVLDRTLEPTASGEPLFLDVVSTLYGRRQGVQACSGRYGIADHDFSVPMAESVFAELMKEAPRLKFSVGLVDDVRYDSLPLPVPSVPKPADSKEKTRQCVVWGIGGDGSVSASKHAAVAVGREQTDRDVQVIFQYDAHKTGGLTMSHVRFSPETSAGGATHHGGIGPGEADTVGCSVMQYLRQYDVLDQLRPGGSLLLNTPASTIGDLETRLPAKVKRGLVRKQVRLFAVDASGIARKHKLSAYTGVIMAAATLVSLSGVSRTPEQKRRLADSFKAEVGKGNSSDAIDAAMESVREIPVPASWADCPDDVEAAEVSKSEPQHVREIVRPIQTLRAMETPVSAFERNAPHGYTQHGVSAFEKRGIAESVPHWKPSKCIQCNKCSFVCPHAAIRPWLSDSTIPGESLPALGAAGTTKRYRVQVSPLDCLGCRACITACPTGALSMGPQCKEEASRWEAMVSSQSAAPAPGDPKDVRTSQLRQPLMEFAGACAGCPEPVYAKLLTQIVGEKLVVANGIGCSTVWSGTGHCTPYTTDARSGRGPAWGCSLFENTAEYGLGMLVAYNARRAAIKELAAEIALDPSLSQQLRDALNAWLKVWKKCPDDVADNLAKLVAREAAMIPKGANTKRKVLSRLAEAKSLFRTQCHWIIGGDGWAHDIGFAGLDHILNSRENVRILVLDNENYANTGGQQSKATPAGAIAKLQSNGKVSAKKDLGLYALLMHRGAYVASVCYGADQEQTLKALKEAEKHEGPSLVVAYCPCIEHAPAGGFDGSHALKHMKDAVSSGYWSLYRRDPATGLTLDSRKKGKAATSLANFMGSEGRFTALVRKDPKKAELLQQVTADQIEWRNAILDSLADK